MNNEAELVQIIPKTKGIASRTAKKFRGQRDQPGNILSFTNHFKDVWTLNDLFTSVFRNFKACVAKGERAWQRGVCVAKGGGVHGEEGAWQRGACMAKGGHVWQREGMHGRGAWVVGGGAAVHGRRDGH